jgi:hypothetical protein
MKYMDSVGCGYSNGYGCASLASLTSSDWLPPLRHVEVVQEDGVEAGQWSP